MERGSSDSHSQNLKPDADDHPADRKFKIRSLPVNIERMHS